MPRRVRRRVRRPGIRRTRAWRSRRRSREGTEPWRWNVRCTTLRAGCLAFQGGNKKVYKGEQAPIPYPPPPPGPRLSNHSEQSFFLPGSYLNSRSAVVAHPTLFAIGRVCTSRSCLLLHLTAGTRVCAANHTSPRPRRANWTQPPGVRRRNFEPGSARLVPEARTSHGGSLLAGATRAL